jgi:AraC-like DNA-binding protein
MPTLTLKEIADHLGYKDMTSFSREWKTLSPEEKAQFRQACGETNGTKASTSTA